MLESERLISVRRGVHGGARVHAPTCDVAARYAALVLEHRSTTLADVCSARAVLEPPCAAILARRRSDAEIGLLRAALAETEGSLDDSRSANRAHGAFHALVVRLAGNQTLVLLADMLSHIIALGTESHADVDSAAGRRAMRKAFRAHQRVVDLIQEGAADEAQALWRRHLDEAEDHLLEGGGTMTVLDLLG